MSRHDFLAFVLKPLSRLRSCVATSFLSVQLIPVSLPKDLCPTIKTPFKIEVCRNITLLVATMSVHPLSSLCRDLVFLSLPKLLLQHLFCLNKLFHVAEVSVATDILPSVQHYVATQTILFPTD